MMDASVRSVRDLVERVRAEYLEMPGLRLTSEQLARLCGIDRGMCDLVLEALSDRKFLALGSDGRYGRLTGGESIQTRRARADLDASTRPRKAS
jgi:hypothetical protein